MKELLLDLKQRGINIEVINDELRLSNIPAGFEETDLMKELKKNKGEIIQYIKTRKQANVEIKRIPKVSKKDGYIASPQQRRLFFLFQISPLSLFYNVSQAYQIKGHLDVARLKKAFQTLIERHESLRTSFSVSDKKVIQKISDESPFSLEYIKAGDEEISAIISKFIRPFDLTQNSLLRVGVIEIGKGQHILLLDMHHLISDGVSQQILIREFADAYNNKYLPELSIQYKDYSTWVQDLHKDQIPLLKDFWVNKFRSLPDPCRLPLDFPRPEAKNYDGGTVNFSVDQDVTKLLYALAYRANTSLFTVLISAFGVLLSKLTGQNDIVIGTPVSGRTHPDLNNIVGLFVNTLPIRLRPDSRLTYRSYLEQVSSGVLACFDHQDYPFEQLIDDLNLDRNLSHNPLFDILFVFQNAEQSVVEFQDLEVSTYPLDNGSSKFDLSLAAMELSGQINFSFEFSKQLFKQSTIERFTRYFSKILTDIARNENILLEEVDIVSDSEKSFLLNVNNNLSVAYPKDKTIIDLFEEQVNRRPNAVALIFENTELTYEELNRRSNQLARILRAKGCGSNTIVGLLTGRGYQTIIGMLAILKAGGAYLPIDVDYPAERIQFQLSDSGVELLVTESAQEGVISGYPYGRIFTDKIDLEAQDPSDLKLEISPSDLCYIIYTSGTTGKPKGAMIEHKNVVRLLFNEGFQFDFGPEDVWTMFHSHTFDFSVWEMYGALLYGGKLIIIKKEEALDPARYLKILTTKKVTVLNQTPTAFGNLIQEDLRNKPSLSSLRYVIFGGEALKPFKLKKWYQHYPNVRLINMFGITETTVHVTYKEITGYEIESNLSTIGKPIPTTSVYLFTENRRLTPLGVVGELYVGGEGVSRGYLNKEELSSERFLINPYRRDERLYRTGDLGRVLENGEIEYFGRADRQVQLRGFRIEPGEVEFHLSQHPLIDNALVIFKMREDGKSYLCAYCVTKHDIPVGSIREYLQDKIPLYMIPSYFIPISHLPQTGNDKIDVSQLPEPEILSEPDYIDPETSLEKSLAKIWSEELSVKKIGLRDNFFAIGGDSLLAIGVIHKTNAEFNCKLTIADLYKNQTIETLAALIQPGLDQDTDENYNAAIEELRLFQENYKKTEEWDDSCEEVFPMNGVEKGMVFYSLKQSLDKGNIHEVFYHEQNILRIANRFFDVTIFKKSIELLVEKHSEFRKIYDLKNFAHIVKKTIEPEVHYTDVSDLDPDAQEILVLKKIEDEKLKATDLDHSILWRMNILKIDKISYLILFDMHHSLLDGWSLNSFITELSNTYKKLLTDPLFRPVKLKSSYRDHIIYELAESKKIENISFWHNEMTGSSRLSFLRRRKENTFADRRFALGEQLRSDLELLSKRYNTTLKHLCFAAYVHTMKLYTSETDIVVGITTNNRPVVPDGEKLLGCYLNVVPFRVTISDNMTIGSYIKLIETKLRTLKKHERIPFQEIVQMAGPRDQTGNPFFDTFFNYTNFRTAKEMEILDGAEKFHSPYEGKLRVESYMNLNTFCEFHVMPDPFYLYITYATAYFDESTIEGLSGIFYNTLCQFIKNEDLQLNQINILSDSERNQLLYDFNNTSADYPKDKTIMDLFEEQVEKTPDNVAVKCKDTIITYQELKEKSDRMAIYLQQAEGVKKGDLVGLLLDREEELIPAIFGIMKSGATYVPLSPGYPSARLNSIISDAGLKVLITRKQHLNALSIEMKSGLLDLDSSLEKINEQRSSMLEAGPGGNDVGYIIYTSGSTGKPKGVVIEHHSIVNRLLWMQKRYVLTEKDVLLQKTPLVFDVSVWELFWWSFTGASVCLLPPEGEKDPRTIISEMERNGVTTIHFVPSMLNAFLDGVGEGDQLQSLRQVFASGEALSADQVNRFGKTLHATYGTRLINLYGPTEATVDVSYYECDLGKNNEVIPIGKPIDNIRLYILGRNSGLTPLGIAGELCIGGAGLARGYLNRADLTAERFVRDPFSQDPEARLYRTGDLAYWLPDGNIRYLGRMDDQVKIRGNRIEPGEIENWLVSHPGIKEAVVLAREREGDKYLVGYYVSEKEISPIELRNYLSGKLPDYMLPVYYVHMKAFPITSSGKTDRKSLPDPQFTTGEDYVAPVTNEEQLLCEVWSTVLGVEQVGITDNFFSLGGDSIKSIQISSRMRIAGYKISVKDIVTYQTVTALSVRLEAIGKISDQSSVKGEVPLTGIQQRFFHENLTRKHHYNQSVMLNFPERITRDAVQLIFERLQDHHDALRMVYRKKGEQIIQYNLGPGQPLSVEYSDLRDTVSAPEKMLSLSNELQSGINLEQGPLVRLGLFDLADGSRLQIVIHHLVTDGVSWRILFEDIETLYRQMKAGEELQLSMKTDSFKLWSEQLRSDYIGSKRYTSAVAYWNSALTMESLPITRDRASGTNAFGDAVSSGFRLGKTLTDQLLGEVHSTFNTQINDILLAGLLMSINKHYGDGAVQIDLEAHGREEIMAGMNVGRTIGWFTSLYPVILVPSAKGLSGLIISVKESLRSVPNNGIDYLIGRHLTEDIRPGIPSRIIFNYLGQFDNDTANKVFSIANEPAGPTVSPENEREYDWEISGIVMGNELSIQITYSNQRYDQLAMDALMASYKASLEKLISHCLDHGSRELTPSDLTYKGLTISQLEQLQEELVKYEQ